MTDRIGSVNVSQNMSLPTEQNNNPNMSIVQGDVVIRPTQPRSISALNPVSAHSSTATPPVFSVPQRRRAANVRRIGVDQRAQLVGHALNDILSGKIDINSGVIRNTGGMPGEKDLSGQDFFRQLSAADYRSVPTEQLAKLGHLVGARPAPDTNAAHMLPSLSPVLHRELAKRYEDQPHFAALRDLDLLSFSAFLSRDFKTDSFITSLQTGKPASDDTLS